MYKQRIKHNKSKMVLCKSALAFTLMHHPPLIFPSQQENWNKTKLQKYKLIKGRQEGDLQMICFKDRLFILETKAKRDYRCMKQIEWKLTKLLMRPVT